MNATEITQCIYPFKMKCNPKYRRYFIAVFYVIVFYITKN